MAGRKSVISDEKLGELRMAFKGGMNQAQACAACGISISTFHRYIEKHPEFREEIRSIRETINARAIININAQIYSGSPEWSRWRLEYQSRLEIDKERKRTEREKRKTERLRQQLMQKELDCGTNTVNSDKTPSGFMKQFLSELNGEESEDEQQDS